MIKFLKTAIWAMSILGTFCLASLLMWTFMKLDFLEMVIISGFLSVFFNLFAYLTIQEKWEDGEDDE